ncbi:MAG TPA: phosphate ABC transporter substrate-binding protein [Nitrospirae bacterium]|nr:phosphate ABC transporter substrate-binding protein [Nitrospirota bacterium]
MRLSYFILALLVISPAFSEVQAGELVFAGSTTVQKRILEPAASSIEKATGIKVKILGVGTGKGFKQLRAGKVKASIASNTLESLLIKYSLPDNGTYISHLIAKDVIVPIVYKDNPVSSLSWQQLSDINSGKIKNWSEVGGKDQIILVVTSHAGSATRDVFQKQVMKKEPYAGNARVVKSTRQEVRLVSKYKGGIGAVSEGFIALNPGQVKTIKTKEISRPLIIITKGKPKGDIKKVIDYLKTEEARKNFI